MKILSFIVVLAWAFYSVSQAFAPVEPEYGSYSAKETARICRDYERYEQKISGLPAKLDDRSVELYSSIVSAMQFMPEHHIVLGYFESQYKYRLVEYLDEDSSAYKTHLGESCQVFVAKQRKLLNATAYYADQNKNRVATGAIR